MTLLNGSYELTVTLLNESYEFTVSLFNGSYELTVTLLNVRGIDRTDRGLEYAFSDRCKSDKTR